MNSEVKPVRGKIVALMGSIGVGKSTLQKALLKELPGAQILDEGVKEWQSYGPDGTNLLAAFYANPQRWAFTFHLVVSITQRRIYQHAQTLLDQGAPFVLIERSPIDSRQVFFPIVMESGYVTPLEAHVYHELLEQAPWRPDLSILLDVPEDVAFDRIVQRSRPGEEEIDRTYLHRLNDQYNEVYGQLETNFTDTVRRFNNGMGRNPKQVAKEIAAWIQTK